MLRKSRSLRCCLTFSNLSVWIHSDRGYRIGERAIATIALFFMQLAGGDHV